MYNLVNVQSFSQNPGSRRPDDSICIGCISVFLLPFSTAIVHYIVTKYHTETVCTVDCPCLCGLEDEETEKQNRKTGLVVASFVTVVDAVPKCHVSGSPSHHEEFLDGLGVSSNPTGVICISEAHSYVFVARKYFKKNKEHDS